MKLLLLGLVRDNVTGTLKGAGRKTVFLKKQKMQKITEFVNDFARMSKLLHLVILSINSVLGKKKIFKPILGFLR